ARRAGMNRAKIQELNRYFMEAPQKVHDFFQIESFAGEVESYTDQKLLLYASRKEKEKK
ncbi:MAG: SAM-dependent methyltransferase, partial [Deltaproteobacteria bacterium]|nr:SAM-dependent methyltransferase [Deltaproteobacteria bacterium]